MRRVKLGQPYAVPPNCGRVGTISALRNKNIPNADASKQICSTCKFLETCRAGAGSYDYLNDRANTLSQQRLRAHPASLPEPSEYDYGEVVVIWDEAGEIFKAHRSIEVSEQDLNITVAQLALKSPETFDILRPLLNTLHDYVSEKHKQPNKFGWGDAEVRKLLPAINNIDVDAIALALKPDLDSLLNTTSEYGVDLGDLPRQVRKSFSESDEVTADRIQQEVTLNWLPDFLNVLLSNVIGSLRIQNGVLTLTVPEQRLATIAQAAKTNIFLDATATPEDLARVLGCDRRAISF